MPTSIFCAPSSGLMMSNSVYCQKAGTPPHRIITGGYNGPFDIECPSNGAQRLYVTQVNSVYCQRVDYCCESRAHPWTRGVAVKLYSDTNWTNKIGTVLYAHLEYQQSTGYFNNNIWGMWIGSTPSTDCGCTCYSGHHIHMEQTGASIINNIQCGATITASSTWMYKFQW